MANNPIPEKKNIHVTETVTEEMNTTGCDGQLEDDVGDRKAGASYSRDDATICTFLELSRADGQDQGGIEPTQERSCHTVEEATTNTTGESPSS